MGQSASLFWCRASCGAHDQILIFFVWQFLLHVGHPLWWEDGSAIRSAITHWLQLSRTHNHMLLSHPRLPQPKGLGPCHPQPPWTGWSSPKSKVSHATTNGQSASIFRYRVHTWKSNIKRATLRQPLGRLHVKHAVQLGIWVPTQHLLWDQGKPWKTLIELSGRRTFRMQTDF
jgi:hypothetical protein